MIVQYQTGASGYFERAVRPELETFEFRYSFREDLPAWMPDFQPPLVPGKGVPLTTYVTLRMMKQLDVDNRVVRAFVVRCIHEVEAVVHLDWLVRQRGNERLGELARHTHSYLYAETPIIQAGYQILNVDIDSSAAERRPIGDLLTHYEFMSRDPAAMEARHDQILARYSATRRSDVLIGYDLRIDVAS